MRPARLAKNVAVLLAISAVIGAACTFPHIDFNGTDGGATASSSSSGGALPCDGGACDCDGDQETAWDCDGSDCADYDPRANTKAIFLPDITPIFGPRRSGTPDFDFNCNLQEEREFDAVQCHFDGLACVGKGLAKTTECGQMETLIGCGKVELNPCTQLSNPPKQSQRCR